MKVKELTRLVRKALIFRLMIKVDHLVHEADLSHSKISTSSGQQHNWFNDAFNNSEDISLSSLARIISVISSKTDLSDYKLTDMFDDKILEIAKLMSKLPDEKENLSWLIRSEQSLFEDLLRDWALLKAKRKISENEQRTIGKIQSILADDTEEEQ